MEQKKTPDICLTFQMSDHISFHIVLIDKPLFIKSQLISPTPNGSYFQVGMLF